VFRFPGDAGIFVFVIESKLTLASTQPPFRLVLGDLRSQVKRSDRENHKAHPSSAELMFGSVSSWHSS